MPNIVYFQLYLKKFKQALMVNFADNIYEFLKETDKFEKINFFLYLSAVIEKFTNRLKFFEILKNG